VGGLVRVLSCKLLPLLLANPDVKKLILVLGCQARMMLTTVSKPFFHPSEF
jgi:hypothetical protein